MKSAYRDHAFVIALASIATANSVLFLYFVEKASIRVPVYDLLDWLQFYDDRMQTNDWFGYLWSPHNEHRLVLSRILLAIDVRWFDSGGTAFAIFGLVLLMAMAASLSWEILKSDLSRSWKAAVIPFAILLLMPADTVVMIGMPALGIYLHTSAFAVFSLVLLDGVAEQGRFSDYRRGAAIIAGCLTSFGVSGGLLIWLVLMWLAWRGNLGWRWIAGVACVGSLFIAVYLWGLPLSTMPTSFNVGHLVEMFDYAIRFLGLPWSHMHQLVWPARLLGFGMLCLGAGLLIHGSFAAGSLTRLQRIGLALILFVFLLAAAAALARVDVAKDREMPVRYGMFVVLAHVGILLYALPFLQRVWHGRHQRSLQWLTLGIAVTLVGQQIVIGRFAVQEASRYNQAWSHFVAGDWTPDMLHYVYPDRERAREGLAHLRKMGLHNGE